ncbi:MAG TPA: polysaccharide biosynthesis/export family protein [Opitutaceae bacterium]|jgi:polysaccharide export outer membrane protein|nr:polysaccharide biosynthesis/export family protein [Opitutaceae bacterium]
MNTSRQLLSRLLPLLVAVVALLAAASPLQADGPLPAAGDGVIASYSLATTDRLRIGVYQEDDLSSIVRIDANGNVNLPLIGEVKIAGLTVRNAQKAIEDAYRNGRFLRNPQVTITVEEYAPREVAIEGQVRNPGRYPLPIESTMSVIDLVTKAGGLTDIAKGTAVSITRISPDGKKITYTVDVESIIKGRKNANPSDSSLQLQPGDIVYVPESLI